MAKLDDKNYHPFAFLLKGDEEAVVGFDIMYISRDAKFLRIIVI